MWEKEQRERMGNERESREKKMSNISDDEYERSCLIEHPKK